MVIYLELTSTDVLQLPDRNTGISNLIRKVRRRCGGTTQRRQTGQDISWQNHVRDSNELQ